MLLPTLFKKLTVGLSLVLLLGAQAAAQTDTLENTWMKLKVQVKGYQVMDDESLQKAASRSTHYINFKPPVDAIGPALMCDIWSEVSPGNWQIVDSGQVRFKGTRHVLFRDWSVDFELPNGAWFGGYHTGTIKIKLDKKGGLKGAILKTLGGESCWGTIDDEHLFGGSLKISGKTIPTKKLPFTP